MKLKIEEVKVTITENELKNELQYELSKQMLKKLLFRELITQEELEKIDELNIQTFKPKKFYYS